MLEKVSLSVVNIGTLKHMQRNFYQAVPVRGAGSGIIIEEDGLILTNRGSPAEKSGIIPGDIVLEFNGKEINTAEELVAETEKINPGDKVEIVILRQAKKRTVSAILEATP